MAEEQNEERVQFTEQELREKAAAFDRRFGRNALEQLSGTGERVRNGFADREERREEVRAESEGQRDADGTSPELKPGKTGQQQKAPAAVEPGNPRQATVRQLRAFANDRAQAGYVPAEVAIALSLARQLEAGARDIDLSQRYWTVDPAAAEERHRKALENLKPVLLQAQGHAETLDYGKAIAHGARQGEVLAVVEQSAERNTELDIGRGLGRAAGVLQKAGSHSQHVVQAPRLSMGESAGGGL